MIWLHIHLYVMDFNTEFCIFLIIINGKGKNKFEFQKSTETRRNCIIYEGYLISMRKHLLPAVRGANDT